MRSSKINAQYRLQDKQRKHLRLTWEVRTIAEKIWWFDEDLITCAEKVMFLFRQCPYVSPLAGLREKLSSDFHEILLPW